MCSDNVGIVYPMLFSMNWVEDWSNFSLMNGDHSINVSSSLIIWSQHLLRILMVNISESLNSQITSSSSALDVAIGFGTRVKIACTCSHVNKWLLKWLLLPVPRDEPGVLKDGSLSDVWLSVIAQALTIFSLTFLQWNTIHKMICVGSSAATML